LNDEFRSLAMMVSANFLNRAGLECTA